ncbi:MAG: sugar phosphate nucleotidyltransferase [Candidatus Aenigmarchaeota archaeon]|nr:sugar phosphate nucleotidyltransferase [Candidatus Aenigmarchaeota archaeon]MDI6722354.1 sugar phosphate nucleotidyltransferase [Candidatus Aenigmarchaeota archaeon]
MIERVTITLKHDMLKRLDKMVDKRTVRNRSHAVETLLSKALTKTDIDTALILAGGEGVNLRPITYEIPKPLIPINGRPMLEHQIQMLKKYDIRNLIVSVGYMKERIIEYFGNGSKFGMNIEYIIEDKPFGSAGCLIPAKDLLRNDFIMLNVDTLMNPDIYDMYEFHRRQGTIGSMLLSTSPDTRNFGVVKIRGNIVTSFTEKPKKSHSNIINAGLYIFKPEVVKFVTKQKFMMWDLLNRLVKENQLSGYVYDGFVADVGTYEGYEKAIKQLRGKL